MANKKDAETPTPEVAFEYRMEEGKGAKVQVHDDHNKQVAEYSCNKDGKFKGKLPPGEYRVVRGDAEEPIVVCADPEPDDEA